MIEDPLKECPTCGGEVRRVINQVGVVFKGSGFYVTDTKSKNPAAPSTNGSDAEKSTADKKSDSAPAVKDTSETTSKPTESTSP